MKAIIDILKENNLYTFMLIKETLIQIIEEALQTTEYKNKYGISGSFTTSDQTISIVVGILAEQAGPQFMSAMIGMAHQGYTTSLREYTYGINITGINDNEVKNIAIMLFNYIINKIYNINKMTGARFYSNLFMQPITMSNVGEKRFWSVNIYAQAAINEVYPNRPYQKFDSGNGLDIEGADLEKYTPCITVKK